MSVENRFQELMSTFLSTTGLPKFERRHPVAPAGASRRKEMRRADAATGFWSLLWWLSSRPVVLKSSFRGCGRETILRIYLPAPGGNCHSCGMDRENPQAGSYIRELAIRRPSRVVFVTRANLIEWVRPTTSNSTDEPLLPDETGSMMNDS